VLLVCQAWLNEIALGHEVHHGGHDTSRRFPLEASARFPLQLRKPRHKLLSLHARVTALSLHARVTAGDGFPGETVLSWMRFLRAKPNRAEVGRGWFCGVGTDLRPWLNVPFATKTTKLLHGNEMTRCAMHTLCARTSPASAS